MTNKQIRERLLPLGQLEYFEKNIGEVVFYGDALDGYFMYPKGKEMLYDNLLTTQPAYDIYGLNLFMQGVCQSERVRRCFDD